ncbi:MAG: ClpXP protease specificity-enhancing factor SspB [Polyangiaceae bacterium]
MASPPALPPKKEVALALLERSSIFVHLDPRRDGVAVPAWFKKQPQLVLQIGLNMPVPIPDLHLDDDGMTCTLSFNRAPFYCVMPWTSIFALVGEDGRAMVWPDDIPKEIAAQAESQGQPKPKDGARPQAADVKAVPDPKPAKRGHLELAPSPKALKTKKPRKKAQKGDAERNRLAAVPPPSPSSTAGTEGAEAERPVARIERAKAPPAAGETVRRPPEPKAKKPKRELPPYLRVVK